MPRRLAAAALALLAGAANLSAASLFDPALRFRRFATPNFIIYYHQGEERLASRLARIAEDTRERLAPRLGVPSSRTHVVLADQTELSNGWATPVPYNTIVLTAAWPAGAELTGHVDDWLRSVFVHEFTHVLHLERSNGWARVVRRLFGRPPLAFPNLFLPVWQIEGVATLEESRDQTGRRHAADFRAIVREAARHDVLEPIDRLNGGLTDWPGPQAPYAFGLGFHAYLEERFGARALADLADASASAIPFVGSSFEQSFGLPLGTVFEDFLAAVEAEAGDADPESPSVRLTTHGFDTTGPRFLPAACAECLPEVAYTTATPHDFPSISVVRLNGAGARRIVSRYLGRTISPTPTHIVFDQYEVRRFAGLYSDLYALDRASGHVTQLTREARLLDPDVSPDGTAIVAVRQNRGERSLVVLSAWRNRTGMLEVRNMRTLVADPDTQFNVPRWSPDGTTIVAERHRLGAFPEIVTVNVMTAAVHTVASSPGHRFVTPAWHPNGRAVIAAADFDGVFNLHEFVLAGGSSRRLTSTAGGARWPDISADGRMIAYVGYTSDGFDVFTTPYPDESVVLTSEPPAAHLDPTHSQATASGPQPPRSSTYRPWDTLRPRYWTPLVGLDDDQLRLGAATSGVDVLQYHGFSAGATWLVDVRGRNPIPHPGVPNWNLQYVYTRWQPTFFVAASSTTTLVNGRVDEVGSPTVGFLQEQALDAGVVVPTRRVRSFRQWLVSARVEASRLALGNGRESGTESALRAGWMRRTAREYGYSISLEDGTAIGAALDWRPDVGGSAAASVTMDGRVYRPGLQRNHVVALRGAFGVSSGATAMRRRFLAGGSRAASSTLDFARDALGLLRGFDRRQVSGSHVTLANAEYRWPLARPQRGVGTLPVMFHTVHAALFLDAGYAWDREFRRSDLKTSLGGELSVDVVAGYHLPLTIGIGAAWTRDGAAPRQDGGALFARIGRSF
jgi:hypothetical protein